MNAVDLGEFDTLAERLRQESARSMTISGFSMIDGRTATASEITDVERQLGVILPEKYKAFMMRYGGGQFGYVDLFPLTSPPVDAAEIPNSIEVVGSINREEFPDREFVAVAPVGTGDHWGFPVTDNRCHDEVWFHFHDDPALEFVAADFLEFVARHGVRVDR